MSIRMTPLPPLLSSLSSTKLKLSRRPSSAKHAKYISKASIGATFSTLSPALKLTKDLPARTREVKSPALQAKPMPCAVAIAKRVFSSPA